MKLPSDEKKIVSKNDQDRLDDEDVLEGDGRWSTTRTVAVVMETTMGLESGTTRPIFLPEHLNYSGIQRGRS